MTTIVYDGKTLVSDSRCSIGDMIYEEDCTKLFPNIGPFAVLAVAGDYQSSMDVIECIQEYNRVEHVRGLDFDELGWECAMIGVTPEGTVWHYTGTYSFELRPDLPFAIGSGAPYALGALAHGADAKEAVKIAARFDKNTNDILQIANFVHPDDNEVEEEQVH